MNSIANKQFFGESVLALVANCEMHFVWYTIYVYMCRNIKSQLHAELLSAAFYKIICKQTYVCVANYEITSKFPSSFFFPT